MQIVDSCRSSRLTKGPGSSLRRRVAYSLLVVRLILVPVIFLAVYYRKRKSSLQSCLRKGCSALSRNS